MKKLMFASVFLSFAAFAADFELKGDASKGETHYKAMCVACHGEKGDGNGPAGATLNPKPGSFTDPANAERLTPEWIYKMVKNGGQANGKSPLMVAWAGALNDQQLRDVSAFVLKFKPAAAAKKAEPAKAEPAKKK